MTDIGTGSYTILAQIAAETMGVTMEQVVVEIGDSGFAPAPGSGGQFGAATAGSAALAGGMALRARLAEMAVADPASPLYGASPEAVDFRDGLITVENRSETLASLVSRLAPQGVEVEGSSAPAADIRDFASYSHGAQFAEVGVDPVTGEVRMRRMLGVFACGRILNAKTARSQITGGMIWGVGTALTEVNRIDPRYGSLSGQDLGTYLAPVHADIVDLDAYFLPEVDDKANPLGHQGRRRGRHLRRRRGGGQRRLQRLRGAGARLPDHPGERAGGDGRAVGPVARVEPHSAIQSRLLSLGRGRAAPRRS